MRKILGILFFAVALTVGLAIAEPETFLLALNLKNLLRLTALFSILAIGEGLVIITGGIDLSVGSIVGYSALLAVYFMNVTGLPTATAIILVIGIMLGVGAVQGLLITRLSLQPFIVTLGGMMVLRGLAQVRTGGGALGLGSDHPTFQQLGGGFLFGKDSTAGSLAGVIPVPLVIMLLIAALAHFLMHQTIFGRYLYAIGRNEEAARFSGINVKRIKMLAYLISAGTAAIAGILYAGYLSSVQPSLGTGFELYAVAAAVLGGSSLRGGEGTVPGIIIGTFVIRVIANGINLLGIPSFWEQTVTGGVILLAALLDVSLHRSPTKKSG